MKTVWLGRIDYTACWKLQNELAAARLKGDIEDTLLLLEHPPTITLGRSAKTAHLLASENALQAAGVEVVEVDRGGDITYHGPGQLVGYPIFDLRNHGQDLHLFLRLMEEVLIRSLSAFGLEGRRFAPHTGVWIDKRKIAAIGIKVGRWISTHGFALNVDPDMSHFELIIPCGIRDYPVTSVSAELGRRVKTQDIASPVTNSFRAVIRGSANHCTDQPANLSPLSRAIMDSAVEIGKDGALCGRIMQ